MRALFAFAVVGLVLSALPAQAVTPAPTPQVNTACDGITVGTTKMDTDQKNIIACLKTDVGTQVWKSMSSSSDSSPKGTLCGFAVQAGLNVFSSMSPCNGQNIVGPGGGLSCPPGYSPIFSGAAFCVQN